jgi:hypothetical protein
MLVWRHAIKLSEPASRPVLIEHLRKIESELGIASAPRR